LELFSKLLLDKNYITNSDTVVTPIVRYKVRITRKLIIRTSTKATAMMINMIALLAVAATPSIAVEAQTAAAPTTTTTIIGNSTTDTTPPQIELSQQPILKEHTITVSETPINYAHMSITYTGNGTLTLPNDHIDTDVNFTINGSALISSVTQSAQGTEILRTEDGETAISTFYEIAKFNPITGNGNGVITAMIDTNPAGTLAPLNDMILIGIDDFRSNGESNVTFWEWESRISDLDLIPVQYELNLR
jgi:hypothetical protein